MYPYAQEIIPKIWIGDNIACKDKHFLQTNNIQIIVNCTPDIENHYEPLLLKPLENYEDYFIKYFRIPIKDNVKNEEQQKFIDYAPTIYKKLDFSKNILIHCSAGQQRSCAFAVFVICVKEKLPMEEGIKQVINKRINAFNYNGYSYNINFQEALNNLLS